MKRVLLILLGVAVVIGLAVALLLASGARPVRTVVTVGGMNVELLQVLPSGQQFTTEKKWHALAKKVLPYRFQSWIPASSSGSCSSGANSITVYIQVTSTNGVPVNGLPWENYRAESLDGELFSAEGGHCSFGGGMGGSPQIFGLSLRTFPRRDRSFILRFTKYDGTELGSLIVANPLTGPLPEWTPRPMPQTATNGDVTVTLKGVTQRGFRHQSYLATDFDVVSTNALWSGTRVTYTSFSDATGNEGSRLSFKEPAWKLVATLHRTEAKRMLDSEKLILADIVPPGAGSVTVTNTSAVLAGVGLRVLAIAGPGMLYRTNEATWAAFPPPHPGDYAYGTSGSSSYNTTHEQHWGFSTPFLIIDLDSTAMKDGAQLFYHGYGPDGRSLGDEHTTGYNTDSKGRQTRAIAFEKWTNGPLAKLEILVSQPKQFEFMINPANVKTNEVKR